jgi:tetratricopeptide (TPR) repeat protein
MSAPNENGLTPPSAQGITPVAEAILPPLDAPSEKTPPNKRGSAAIDPVWLARFVARLDIVLAAVVLLLAFLCASTPARNSDLWLHLATGKALVQGHYHFGSDPFAHAPEGAYWVNPSWLYDLIFYGLYQTIGASSLVLLKASLVVLLAVILLRLSWEEGRLWAPAVCVGLSILALSGRVMLQPIIVSYLFLGLTLWFLERPRRVKVSPALRSYWPLPLLFILWVNLDGWFLLGPLTVILYWLGYLLDGWSAPNRLEQLRRAQALGVVMLACLAACLLNPHYLRVFALPYPLRLAGASGVVRQSPLFHGLFLSPFERLYFRPDFGWNPAGLAYFPLVLFGVLSFALNGRGWRWWRALIWLVFCALSAYQARIIPFFAIVAGPIMAFNFQEFAARRRVPMPAWAIGGRLLTVLAGLALALAAWPGWLQAPPYAPRQWSVDMDPSLQRAAEQFAQWRKDGRLRSPIRVFHSSFDAANYFTWACPEVRSFFDSRLELFSQEAAQDYLTIWQSFMTQAVSSEEGRDVLRRQQIDYVVLSHGDLANIMGPLRQHLRESREWPLLHLDGHTAVFGWRDPAESHRPDAFAEWPVNWEQRAFHPDEQHKAPRQGPGREPKPRYWWDAFLYPAAIHSPDTDEAIIHLNHFDVRKASTIQRHRDIWDFSQAAGFIGLAGMGDVSLAAPLAPGLRATLNSLLLVKPRLDPEGEVPSSAAEMIALGIRNAFRAQQDDGPPALLLLAIRAARKALDVDPDDARAYLALGQAYLQLARSTRERAWCIECPRLRSLRQAQVSYALNQALLLQPDLLQAHFELMDLYHEMGYEDLALKHLREFLRHTLTAGPQPGETHEQFDARIARLRQEIDKRDGAVKHLLDVYEINASGLKVFERARLALSKGLAQKALDLLLSSDAVAFGSAGTKMELELLLATGRLKEVREWLAPEHLQPLGFDEYYWLRFRIAAALVVCHS